jgi:hypothetical protein
MFHQCKNHSPLCCINHAPILRSSVCLEKLVLTCTWYTILCSYDWSTDALWRSGHTTLCALLESTLCDPKDKIENSQKHSKWGRNISRLLDITTNFFGMIPLGQRVETSKNLKLLNWQTSQEELSKGIVGPILFHCLFILISPLWSRGIIVFSHCQQTISCMFDIGEFFLDAPTRNAKNFVVIYRETVPKSSQKLGNFITFFL